MDVNEMLSSASDYIGQMARKSGLRGLDFRTDVADARASISEALGSKDNPRKARYIERAKDGVERIVDVYDLDENRRDEAMRIINTLNTAHANVYAKMKQMRGRKKQMKAKPVIRKVSPAKMTERAMRFIGRP